MTDWELMLMLPEAALAGDSAIPKTQLVAQGSLTKLEEKKLRDMKTLTFFASLSKSNTYMLPVKDGDYDIESLIVLRCVLRTPTSPLELGNALHKAFPHPTVLLFEAPDDRVGVSVAVKRKSRAEHGAVVVESVQGSGLFDPAAEEYAPFIELLRFDSLPQDNLLSFASALSTRCMLSRMVQTLGFYPRCKEAAAEILLCQVKQLQLLQSEVAALENARKDKEITLAESTKIRMQLNDKRQKRDEVAEKIRSLCNG